VWKADSRQAPRRLIFRQMESIDSRDKC
jgi:hypothetical protein